MRSVEEAIREAHRDADKCGMEDRKHEPWPCGALYADDEEHHDYHLALAVRRLLREIAEEAFGAGYCCLSGRSAPKAGTLGGDAKAAALDRLCGSAPGEGGTK